MKKIIFRTDSSYNIGSGHVARCVNLANLLAAECHFICRNLKGNINNIIQENGHILHEINSGEIEIEEELSEENDVENLIHSISPDAIIIDHYGIGHKWERFFIRSYEKILVIDDINRKHISEVAILDQNYRENFQNKYAENLKRFLGPEYCILSKDFIDQSNKKSCPDKVRSIMIYFGGSDMHEQTIRVYNIIRNNFISLKINLVLSENSKSLNTFRSIDDPNLDLFININNMHEIMMKSDLFIGAAGTTSWERAKLGLPTMCITIANNQIPTGEDLHSAKVHYYIGHYNRIEDNDILSKFEYFYKHPKNLKQFFDNSLKLNTSQRLNEVIDFLNN
jgi:UDP-2,4-diacetamido-2,4,6-trideoxy-beta-L-altropyranose hydrolase